MKKFWTLIEVLKGLPNIQPNKSKQLLEECFSSDNKLKEYAFSEADKREIWIEDENLKYNTVIIRTSSIGACKLLELYLKKLLPVKGKIDLPSIELVEYISKGYSKLNIIEKEKQFKFWVEHKDLVPEEEFTFNLLDKIIYKHCGMGSHRLVIGGIEVTKIVQTYHSNSGKNYDHEITISWIDSNNKVHNELRPSIYNGNRSSDPERNWGLGRE